MRVHGFVYALSLLAFAASASAQLSNGDWETGDETGWTQTPETSWGTHDEEWIVGDPNGVDPPDPYAGSYSGQLKCTQCSFGWFQVVPVTPGSDVTVDGYWAGSNISWIEFMLFDFNHMPTDDEVNDVFGPGNVGQIIAYKRDRWGLNQPPTATWDWEQASLSKCSQSNPNCNDGTIYGSCGWVVIGLKLGSNEGNASYGVWDNVTLDITYPGSGTCETYLTATGATPLTWPNNSDVTILITGTYLELNSSVRLVPVAGGDDIIGDSIQVGSGPNETSMLVDFATQDAVIGEYYIAVDQAPPCCGTQVPDPFTLTCASPVTITGLSPASVTDPAGTVPITISGTSVTRLGSVALEQGDLAIEGANLTQVGDDLRADFALGCAPEGTYRLTGVPFDGCPVPVIAPPEANVLILNKTPLAGSCVWRPWAASWSNLNLGEDLDPDNGIYNPTNWDHSFSQDPDVPAPPPDNMVMDTPDGSDYALHWFLAAQPPDFTDDASGSGGVFQEITVTPDVPLKYSFWWKGANSTGDAWFEFLLVDGPFSLWFADGYQESKAGRNNPFIIHKRSLSGSDIFEWVQVTDEDPADPGPFGDRPTTITPNGDTVAVVLKAGRYPRGGVEALFDNVEVWQGTGPNLVTNGDFEAVEDLWSCNNEAIFQDECEYDSWLKADLVILPPCLQPFADTPTEEHPEGDGDVDQDDFGVFQRCYTGPSGHWAEGCHCFDRPEPGYPSGDGDIDITDFAAFDVCAAVSGPGITHAPGTWPAGCEEVD